MAVDQPCMSRRQLTPKMVACKFGGCHDSVKQAFCRRGSLQCRLQVALLHVCAVGL